MGLYKSDSIDGQHRRIAWTDSAWDSVNILLM